LGRAFSQAIDSLKMQAKYVLHFLRGAFSPIGHVEKGPLRRST
jgi:hypothetical protein